MRKEHNRDGSRCVVSLEKEHNGTRPRCVPNLKEEVIMGLFSKEECFICGKKVGALSRTKIKSGEFICSDCQKLGHPFVHIAYMNRGQVESMIEEMKAHEAHFQEVKFNFRKTSRMTLGKHWTFYDNMQTGEFVLETPETEHYPNHFVYNMRDVFPYEKADQFVAGLSSFNNRETARQTYFNLIQVEEKKTSEGKTESWILRIPYNRENMDIRIKFPGSMAENDVRLLQATIQAVIGSYNAGFRLTPTQLEEIQKAGKSLGNDSASVSAAQALTKLFTKDK